MDIVRKLQQVAIILDDNAFVATLPPARRGLLRPRGDSLRLGEKKMAASKMPPIKPLGVGGAEPLHCLF